MLTRESIKKIEYKEISHDWVFEERHCFVGITGKVTQYNIFSSN